MDIELLWPHSPPVRILTMAHVLRVVAAAVVVVGSPVAIIQ